ncbi:sigma-70 family RNA polymerase sigma factor [Rhabdobacter roseus]|uniref:RNA polymerase sigma factor (Sigma-70 family) n=1 Tax=Rhabdobacter roseus TaxID=1655419 RepID=A0A840U2D8_9BACT|nr:sigma-70 family RNA polymerase sigma factor [Rhabdobacter roseus]MBB5286009.1 RNA polymerase sigma factor (sigma-70 family) [Rhabdobacter roseus]
MHHSKVPSWQPDQAVTFSEQGQEYALWQAFKQGDRDAFATLLNHYYPILLNYGVRFQSDREFVKDCLQDLFIELWNRRENLDDVRLVKLYLLKSLRRKLLRESQRLRWFREAKEVTDDYSFEVQFAIESYLIHNEIQHEDLKKLRSQLDKLSKRQREAIYLRFFQELEYDNIADIMSINYHSAVNLVYEALKLLRKNWFLTLALTTLFIS